MTDPIEARLKEIEALADAATAGPWMSIHGDSYCAYPSVKRGKDGPHFILYDVSEPDVKSADDDFKYPGLDQDADFIAAARTDVPALCKALREARKFCPRCNLKQFDADTLAILSGEEGRK